MNSVKEGKQVEGISSKNSQLVISCIKDFRVGLNVSKLSRKGERSYTRLNHLRQKVVFMLRLLEKRGIKNVTCAKREDLHKLFNDMREGRIKTYRGTAYKSTGDYIKEFKTFWHWYQKIMRNKGKIIEDITEDLDTRGEKPKFVYFTKEDCERIIDKASYDLKPILALAFDSGARVKALVNIKISDFSNDFKELNIREEISKTFGRKIKLMLCANQIKEYVKKLKLDLDDYLCKISSKTMNSELRELGKKLLIPGQIKFKNLTLYDFRHSSACFWLPRYKSESALKYRFGWKKSDMIHYYTEFLGMKDTINEEDMYVDLTKTGLEKEINKLKKESRAQKQETKTVWKRLDVQDAKINIMIEAAREDKKTGGSFDKHLRKVYLERRKKKHI
jgi:integrase